MNINMSILWLLFNPLHRLLVEALWSKKNQPLNLLTHKNHRSAKLRVPMVCPPLLSFLRFSCKECFAPLPPNMHLPSLWFTTHSLLHSAGGWAIAFPLTHRFSQNCCWGGVAAQSFYVQVGWPRGSGREGGR